MFHIFILSLSMDDDHVVHACKLPCSAELTHSLHWFPGGVSVAGSWHGTFSLGTTDPYSNQQVPYTARCTWTSLSRKTLSVFVALSQSLVRLALLRFACVVSFLFVSCCLVLSSYYHHIHSSYT